jgi:phosphoribosylanthranilate isomerase
MAGVQTKICGLTTPDAVEAVIAARSDFAGLVFHPPSPRNLSLNQASQLGSQMQGRICKVGLFVDADDDAIGAAIAAGRLDELQLQGSESPERTSAIRHRFGLPVWKAIAVAAPGDITRAALYTEVADFILFDAKTPKGALPGGLGLSFDWTLLAAWKAPCPWGLAGGLSPKNVAEAIRITGAPLVDCSSGVESAPGVKDVDLIAAFCQAARTP